MIIYHKNCNMDHIRNISSVYQHLLVHQHGAVGKEDPEIDVRIGAVERNLKLYFEPGKTKETK